MSNAPEGEQPGRYIRPKDLDNAERNTFSARLAWHIEAWAWDWFYWNPMKLLPIDWASNAVAGILKALGPLTSQHRTMIRNLRMVFPDWTDAQIQKVAKGSWETLGHIVGEMPHLKRIMPYSGDGRVEVIGAERLDALREAGKPAVFISGHIANWEVMASSLSNRPLDCQITYRSANNPYIDRRIAHARHAYGIKALTPKGAGTRDLVRALARGGSVALMNDQKFNQGISVPFFGYDAMTAPGPTRLARKFGADLIPVACVRTGPGRYRVTIHEPFPRDEDPDEENAVYNTVLRINRFVEARILETPDQWFWMHNRWPKEAWVKAGVISVNP